MVVSPWPTQHASSLLKEWLPETQGFLLVGGSRSLVLGKCLQALSHGGIFCGTSFVLTVWVETRVHHLRTEGKPSHMRSYLSDPSQGAAPSAQLVRGVMRSLVSSLS